VLRTRNESPLTRLVDGTKGIHGMIQSALLRMDGVPRAVIGLDLGPSLARALLHGEPSCLAIENEPFARDQRDKPIAVNSLPRNALDQRMTEASRSVTTAWNNRLVNRVPRRYARHSVGAQFLTWNLLQRTERLPA
jgi:hypothetical protein